MNGSHLDMARRDQYDTSVQEMLDDRGPSTAAADPLIRTPLIWRESTRRDCPPPGGKYSLVNIADGSAHRLRIGINAVGRFPENELVLDRNYISRRHCVILVHATGGCEVYDTASRNGTRVNGHRIARVDLLPGDVLELCDQCFLVEWVGADGELLPPAGGPETISTGHSSIGKDTA
jgi:hypothetical protein